MPSVEGFSSLSGFLRVAGIRISGAVRRARYKSMQDRRISRNREIRQRYIEICEILTRRCELVEWSEMSFLKGLFTGSRDGGDLILFELGSDNAGIFMRNQT